MHIHPWPAALVMSPLTSGVRRGGFEGFKFPHWMIGHSEIGGLECYMQCYFTSKAYISRTELGGIQRTDIQTTTVALLKGSSIENLLA
jgi:hypothetical protein